MTAKVTCLSCARLRRAGYTGLCLGCDPPDFGPGAFSNVRPAAFEPLSLERIAAVHRHIEQTCPKITLRGVTLDEIRELDVKIAQTLRAAVRAYTSRLDSTVGRPITQQTEASIKDERDDR